MSRKKSTGEKEFAVMRFTFILPENIVENKLNNAVINNIDYLKESIRQNGLRQPIDVLPEKNGTTYRIIGGHRRFAAEEHRRTKKVCCHKAGDRGRIWMVFKRDPMCYPATPD